VSDAFDSGLDISPRELIELAAVDSVFYSRTFFPQTFRQTSPLFHRQIWGLLDSPQDQYIGLEVFRGGAKTTLARANISKRIAYGISRVILPVSASLAHASRTVRWLRKQVETNVRWTSTFRLRKGSKWSDEELEIVNETAECSIYVLAVGITGQIRGVNLDDYRPDFILADDPCDEENSGTEEQRRKTAALFFGALAPGLAPRSEQPFSKMALLQTSLDKDDLINTAHRDPQWKTVRFPILVEEDGKPASAWPDRWPTTELIQMKEAYTRRSQLHLWLREFECTVTSPEDAPLKPEWLKFYDVEPEGGVVYIGIDPAISSNKDAHKFAIVVIKVRGPDVYVLDHFAQVGVNPEQAWNQFLIFALKYRPYQVPVESIAYQKALAFYFREKMKAAGTFWSIIEYQDRRKKRDRILQAYVGRATEGHLYVRADDQEFINSWTSWRVSQDSDLLDAGAIALSAASNLLLVSEDGNEMMPILDETSIPRLQLARACP
jgi:hypothetical protein